MKAAIFYFTMSGNTELAAKEVSEATGAPLIRLFAEPPIPSMILIGLIQTHAAQESIRIIH